MSTVRRVTAAVRASLAVAVLTILLAAAAPAHAADTSVPVQAAHLASRLRTDPVYVTDQLPREVPRSMAPAFAELAERTGVPTYVLVLPFWSTDGTTLLDAVHDRLGRDGLYVLLDESGVTDAAAYGVRAPTDDAVTVASYELPYDAGPLRSFQRFTEAVAQGPEKAAERAEAARDRYDAGNEPADMYIGPSDRENQSFLTGIALTAVPLSILILVPYVRRWRRGLPGAQARQRPVRRARAWIVPAVALLSAAAIAATAPTVFDQTRSSAAPTPTPADLTARADRVAAGLKQNPVYADPESPQLLDARQRARLHDRIRTFVRSDGGGPVYVALVPQLPEDESAGDSELFAAAVHHRVGRDGVYVVADPFNGMIDVVNHGLRLDSIDLYFDLPESIAYGDEAADKADDHLMAERLDRLMTHLDKSPRTEEPEALSDPVPAPNPRTATVLPPLFSGEFWPGLFMGAVVTVILFVVVSGVLGMVARALRRRTPEPTSSLPLSQPSTPTTRFLRRTARTELRALTRDFTAHQPEAASATHTRAADCREAAMLLAGVNRDTNRLADAPTATTDPATLVALIVLARAGRAALADDVEDLVCGVNPLHGPAETRRDVRVSATERNRRRWLPVCTRCLNAAIADPSSVPALLLTLPAPTGDGRVPYDEAGGASAAVREGVPRLVRRVREATVTAR
ncbi:hypothetical protein StrepF001_18695 [Streptomyces sp. F001]|uniref:hypothetical protein n=1 Tax=Streptomyces sp. F001 TaxID=1510026 RepID=UPI00101E7E95|nr:hypothetical protein [Streptomyces sp. F001]RZB17838.1 hypothetical protein StrepF001_18695 [Streptomyces sp. F001]